MPDFRMCYEEGGCFNHTSLFFYTLDEATEIARSQPSPNVTLYDSGWEPVFQKIDGEHGVV